MTNTGSPTAPDHIPEDAWELLAPRLTENRRRRLEAAAHERTRYLRLVVQDIHHPHNVSACLRSAEAFGIQDVDVVTLQESFRPSTVARGVASWLTIRKRETIDECAADLKDQGFRIAGAVPTATSCSLNDLPLDKPLAVVFGNERDGIHEEWRKHLDETFAIPMVGLVESLNISVCAAVTLHHLTRTARETLPAETYFLSPAERNQLLGQWVCRQITSWRQVIAQARRPAPK